MAFQCDPDLAYAVWSQMQATEWKHLPFAGGLLEQPEALWDGVMKIEFMNRRTKEAKENTDG